ncbi:hypothetical protein, partial [Mesorhizobium sp. M7A.F.Ca.CA.001.04.1.1]|uniref:hypothetical protein n=1 Tax=Mesorhizobium sp. M7A.F.Ca.CA.001.04.1.1 TaxID=2496714 RepID=UPI0019D0D691
ILIWIQTGFAMVILSSALRMTRQGMTLVTGTRRRFSCLERVIGGLRTLPIALHVNALMTKGCGTGRRRIRAGTVRIQCENGWSSTCQPST